MVQSYPEQAGAKTDGPSQEAAASVDAKWLRDQVLDVLRGHQFTADECAHHLKQSVLSIRPRLSELRAKGLVRDTGWRRMNRSGRRATVWALREPEA